MTYGYFYCGPWTVDRGRAAGPVWPKLEFDIYLISSNIKLKVSPGARQG